MAYADAMAIVGDDKTAAARLESFAEAHGIVDAGPDVQQVVEVIVAKVGVSPGMAHALVVAASGACPLATYAASTAQRAGFDARLVLDLDEFFRD
jgi:hypothetical protein